MSKKCARNLAVPFVWFLGHFDWTLALNNTFGIIGHWFSKLLYDFWENNYLVSEVAATLFVNQVSVTDFFCFLMVAFSYFWVWFITEWKRNRLDAQGVFLLGKSYLLRSSRKFSWYVLEKWIPVDLCTFSIAAARTLTLLYFNVVLDPLQYNIPLFANLMLSFC